MFTCQSETRIQLLRGDRLTNVLTLYDTLVDSTCEALSRLFFVAIVSCAVEKAVSYCECSFDSLFEKLIGFRIFH